MKLCTIILIIAIPVLSFIFLSLIGRRVDRFRKNLSYGDNCIVFIEEERVIGRIVLVNDDEIVVQVEDDEIRRTRDEIYPI